MKYKYRVYLHKEPNIKNINPYAMPIHINEEDIEWCPIIKDKYFDSIKDANTWATNQITKYFGKRYLSKLRKHIDDDGYYIEHGEDYIYFDRHLILPKYPRPNKNWYDSFIYLDKDRIVTKGFNKRILTKSVTLSSLAPDVYNAMLEMIRDLNSGDSYYVPLWYGECYTPAYWYYDSCHPAKYNELSNKYKNEALKILRNCNVVAISGEKYCKKCESIQTHQLNINSPIVTKLHHGIKHFLNEFSKQKYNFTCPKCGKLLIMKGSYWNQMTGDSMIYECSECGYEYKGYYSIYLWRHLDKMPEDLDGKIKYTKKIAEVRKVKK